MAYKYNAFEKYMSPTTVLLIFYAIIGFLVLIGALLAYAVLTTEHEKEKRRKQEK